MSARGECRRRRLLLGVAVVVGVLVTVLWALGGFSAAELVAGDAHFALRGHTTPDPRIALVLIDPRTLATVDEFPLPRALHARVIDRLRADGARVIAYDVVFAERGPRVADDNALLLAIRRAGNVVVAADATNAQHRPDALFGEPERFRAVAGDSNFALDRGGVYRRVSYDINGIASFAVATARRYGARVTRAAFGSRGQLIDYAGPARSYPSASLSDVLAGRVAPSLIRGRIVIVGASDPTLQDVHPTPTSPAMPGAEVEANAVASVLEGLPLRRTPGWLLPPLVALMALVAPLAAVRLHGRPVRLIAIVVVAGAAFAIASQLVFDAGRLAPLVAPLTALLATLPFIAVIELQSIGVERELDAERHASELRAAQRRAIAAVDEARRLVERDLHDGAQQRLLAISLGLSRAAALADGEVATVFEDASQRVREAVAELRRVAHGVFPPALADGGLDAALEALVDELPAYVVLAARLGRRVAPELEAVAYFVASESLANALKHAQATNVAVTVGMGEGGSLWVHVRDDGCGGASLGGSGLSGLRERVESHGGTLEIESAPGAGTTVRAELPLDT